MWFRFDNPDEPGVLDVKCYQVCWYDMERDGACFDESFYSPDEIGLIISYVETEDEKDNPDRSRVFVHFGNGDSYELVLKKINKNKDGCFVRDIPESKIFRRRKKKNSRRRFKRRKR